MSFSLFVTLFVCSCIVLQTAAQSYQCTPGFCSQATGYDRQDVIGCKYFCYIDTDPRDGFVTCAELLAAYNGWKGPIATGCDQNCYVSAHQQIIPEACVSELDAAYVIYSGLDGDPTDISPADVQLGCDQIKQFQAPPNDNITPDSFAAWWGNVYGTIVDETCPNPIP